jgi:hypothetical protein
MHRGAKALVNQSCQFAGLDGGIVLACFVDEREDLVGELVRLLGATLAWHQAGLGARQKWPSSAWLK